MKFLFLALVLCACTAQNRSAESSGTSENKGAIDDPNFFRRMFFGEEKTEKKEEEKKPSPTF